MALGFGKEFWYGGSILVYEGRLRPAPGNENRVVEIPAGAGHLTRRAGILEAGIW